MTKKAKKTPAAGSSKKAPPPAVKSAAIDFTGGTFSVIQSAHSEDLITHGWSHVGVDEKGKSHFSTSDPAAVKAAAEALDLELTPAASQAVKVLGK